MRSNGRNTYRERSVHMPKCQIRPDIDLQVQTAYLQVMQWDDLRYFLAVTRAGQLGQAASLLGVDATTVGRRLRRLEIAVGTRLFERTRDGQVLTEAGERLVQRAEAMEHAVAEIDHGGSNQHDISGLVRVSVSEGFGTWFVAHHLREFASAHPRVSVDLVANNGFLNPSRRETDVAILLARPRKGPLFTRKLTDYSLGIYVARAYLAANGPIETVDDLRRHPLIGYIPDLVYAPELRYLDEVAPKLAPRIRSSSINAQYRLTAAGAGVAILPCFIGDADSTLTRIMPRVNITRTFWLVTHEDTRQLTRIRLFVDWLASLTIACQTRFMGSSGFASTNTG